MVYLPVVTGALAALFFGISDYFTVKPVRELGQYRAVAYIMTVSMLVLVPFLLYFGTTTTASTTIILLSVFASVFLYLGYLCACRAFRYGDLSIAAPIAGTYPALTVILAILIFRDIPSFPQEISILAVLLGIILVSLKFGGKRKGRAGRFATGAGSAMLAAILYSVSSLAVGVTFVVGVALLSFISRVVGVVCGYGTCFALKQKVALPEITVLKSVALAGVTDAFGALAWVAGVFVIPSSLPIVASVAGFSGGVAAIIAFFALRERPASTQWLGIMLAVVGVVVLAFIS